MGLCSYHSPDDGRVHMVHSSHHFEEVNTVLARVYLYVSLTFGENPRIEYRRAVNKADNKAATVSIDSLINYEAVKVRHPLRFFDVRT